MNTNKIYAESIANEYSVKDASKIIALKKLDRKAKMPSEIFTYSFGIISSLVLGLGMCFGMNVIGDGTTSTFIIGIIVGIIGIIGISINYPIYKKIRENGKKKYANDILLLAKEISDSENSN